MNKLMNKWQSQFIGVKIKAAILYHWPVLIHLELMKNFVIQIGRRDAHLLIPVLEFA